MDNLLINCFFGNDTTSIKKIFSSEEVISEESNGADNFLNILDVRMEKGFLRHSTELTGNQTVVKGTDENTLSGNTGEESTVVFLDTQSIIALLQTYLDTQTLENVEDATPCGEQSVNVNAEDFLRAILSLLQEGESVQFGSKQPAGTVPPTSGSIKQDEMTETDREPAADSEETPGNEISVGYLASILQQLDASEHIGMRDEMTETDREPAADSEETPGNEISVGYLASILQQFVVSETTGRKAENTEKTQDYSQDTTKNELNVNASRSKEMFQMPDNADGNEESIKGAGMKKDLPVLNEAEISEYPENENGEALTSADAAVKPVFKIEVKKLGGKENVFQIVSDESLSDDNEGTDRNVSLLSMKTGKTVFSGDDNALLSAVTETSGKTIDDYSASDGRQLLSGHDYAVSHARLNEGQGKTSGNVPFTSVMVDKIEKIVEHYANKGVSADMVVRLKLDEKETLIVGLKDHGQTVAVEIKTTDESMGNFLSSQKGEITKQLEEKNVYANIHVDMENDNLQKRKQEERNKQKNANRERKLEDDSNTFMEIMV